MDKVPHSSLLLAWEEIHLRILPARNEPVPLKSLDLRIAPFKN